MNNGRMTCTEQHPLQPPRAVIFDLDGTLVDSLDDITNAINEALHNIGLPHVDSTRVRTWIGNGLPVLCQRAATFLEAPECADDLIAEARRAYDVHCTRKTRLYPNMLKTLDLLKRSGVPMAVLSNKPDAFVNRIVMHLQLEDHFVAWRGYLTEQDKKPSPRIALKLAEQLRTAPQRVAFVGDSTVDIETAHNAHMPAIAVTWGFEDREKILQKNPEWAIDDPLELEKIFQLDEMN